MKATIDNMDNIVMQELNNFAKALPGDFEEAGKKAGKAAVKELKRTSPEQSGEYAKGWKTKTEKTRIGAVTTIYQGSKPGLPHLLEYGHALKAGGRAIGQVVSHPHIKRAEENAMKLFEEELKKAVENGN